MPYATVASNRRSRLLAAVALPSATFGHESPMSALGVALYVRARRKPRDSPRRIDMSQPHDFELPSPIDVFRENGASNDARRARFGDNARAAREHRIQELGERVRDAVVRQRVAEAVGERLEGALRDRVREVLRTRFMRDVRTALRDVAMAKSDPDDVGELLDDALSDIIEDRVRDVLREHLGTAVRERA